MADRREVTLRFAAEGASQVSAAVQRIGETSKRAAGSAKALAQSGKQLATGFKDVGTKLLLLPGALVNVGRIVRGVATAFKNLTVGIIDAGGGLADLNTAFLALQKEGINSINVLDALKRATEGQVDATTLQRGILKALGGQFKISTDNLETLVNAVFLVSKQTGNFNQNFATLIAALQRGTPSMLNSITGFDDMADAIDRAARETAKSGKQFTLTVRMAKGLEFALERAETAIRKYGGASDSVSDMLNKVITSMSDFKDETARTIVETENFRQSFTELTAVMGQLAFAFGLTEKSGASLGESLGKMAASVIGFGADVLSLFIDAAAGINLLGADMVNVAGKSAQFWLTSFGAAFVGISQFFSDIATAGKEMAIDLLMDFEGIAEGLETLFPVKIVSDLTNKIKSIRLVVETLPTSATRSAEEFRASMERFGVSVRDSSVGLSDDLDENARRLTKLREDLEDTRLRAEQRFKLEFGFDKDDAREAGEEMGKAAAGEIKKGVLDALRKAAEGSAASAAMAPT